MSKPIAQTTRVHYESILTINEFLKMGNALPLSAVWTIDLRKSYPFIDGASTAVSWWILQKKLCLPQRNLISEISSMYIVAPNPIISLNF